MTELSFALGTARVLILGATSALFCFLTLNLSPETLGAEDVLTGQPLGVFEDGLADGTLELLVHLLKERQRNRGLN
jgi:hypothetical protein